MGKPFNTFVESLVLNTLSLQLYITIILYYVTATITTRARHFDISTTVNLPLSEPQLSGSSIIRITKSPCT